MMLFDEMPAINDKKHMMSIDSLKEIAEENNVAFCEVCPVDGKGLSLVYTNKENFRVQCNYSDKMHNILREKKWFSDPIDCINEWNSYCVKVLKLRKKKNIFLGCYYILTFLPFLCLMLYSFFSPITFVSIIIMIFFTILPCIVSTKILYKYLVLLGGTNKINRYSRLFDKFLSNYKILEEKNPAIEIEQNDFSKLLMDKMKKDNIALEKLINKLDGGVANNIKKLVKMSKEMHEYLLEHPEQIGLCTTFVNIYQENTLNITEKYIDMNNMTSHNKSKILLKEIRETLSKMSLLYQKEYDKITSNDTMDLTAEIKVLQQEIEAIENSKQT